jgi:hypothetical protein
MQVVGNTNNKEVYIASADLNFGINEYLIIEDKDTNSPLLRYVLMRHIILLLRALWRTKFLLLLSG